MRSALLALAILLTGAGFARADFVLMQSPPASRTEPPAQKSGSQTPPPAFARTPDRDQGPSAVHWKIAHGFGDHVPLSFACRQIVPPGVRVIFGPGAQPQMSVSWQGGETWNRVLGKAVARLGLHLVMTHMAVEIRK